LVVLLECDSDPVSDCTPESDSEHEENSVASAAPNSEHAHTPAHTAYVDGVAHVACTSEPRVDLGPLESALGFGDAPEKTAAEWECVDVLEEAPSLENALVEQEGSGEKQDCDVDNDNGAADEDSGEVSCLQSGNVASRAKRRLELGPSELHCDSREADAASTRLQGILLRNSFVGFGVRRCLELVQVDTADAIAAEWCAMSAGERAQLQAVADAEQECFWPEEEAINGEAHAGEYEEDEARECHDDGGDEDSYKDEEFIFQDVDDEKDEAFVHHVRVRREDDARGREYGGRLLTAYMAYTALRRAECEDAELSKKQIANEWAAMPEEEKSRFGQVVAVKRKDSAKDQVSGRGCL
jgi:hypothetical protein